jgi:hypothetical protein
VSVVSPPSPSRARRAPVDAARARARSAALVGGALLVVGCESTPGLRLTPVPQPYVAAAAARYEARFFPDVFCPSLPIVDGAPDRARTATAALAVSSATPDALPVVDLSPYAGTIAVDVRALDANGIPLSQRCAGVRAETTELGLALATFAPDGARYVVERDLAVRVGVIDLPALVRLVDADGAPVENGFVSRGAARPLAATDAQGLARVRTPTDTPSFSGLLPIEVYGVAPRTTLRAETVAAPSCPEPAYSRAVVAGVTGARVEIASAVAGALAHVALVRPESAASSALALEVLTLDADQAALRTTLTTTTTHDGPLAIAAAADGTLRVVTSATDGRLELVELAGRKRRRVTLPSLSLGVGGRVRQVLVVDEAAWIVGDVPGGAVRVALDGGSAPTPLFDAAVSAALGSPRAIAVTPSVVFALGSSGIVRLARATLAPLGAVVAGARGPLAVLDAESVVTLDARGAPAVVTRASTATAARGLAALSADVRVAALGDLNGDARPDLALVREDGAGLVAAVGVGDVGAPAFVEGGACAGPSWIAAVPPSSSGRARWVVLVPSTGVIAVLERR